MKSELKQIFEASFAKRILALIMDVAVTAFVMFGFLVLLFIPIADKTMGYSEKMATQLQYQVASKLFVYYDTDEEGNNTVYELKNIDQIGENSKCVLISEYSDQEDSFYINRVKYYFLSYKTGNNLEYPESGKAEDFRAPNYLDLIEGKLPSELYTEEWFNAKVDELKTKEKILNYAFEDMASQAYYVNNNNTIKSIQYFIAMIPYVLSFSIFFIVIPLCFKNGETLGKKTLHLAFVAKDGYTVKKKQIVYRQILLLGYTFLCAFSMGVGITSIAILGFGVLIYFIPTFINKLKRSPADMIAYTLLVDTLHSVWFSSKEEEDAKNSEIDENISKLNKNSIDTKRVIQVGSTIVNEDVKREIEEQNKKEE